MTKKYEIKIVDQRFVLANGKIRHTQTISNLAWHLLLTLTPSLENAM